jgi:hypothetical protein
MLKDNQAKSLKAIQRKSAGSIEDGQDKPVPVGPGRGRGSRPNRKKTKKQLTVRVDDDIWERSNQAAALEHFENMTDYIEDSLNRRNADISEDLFALRLRLLITKVPLQWQRKILAALSFMSLEHKSPERRSLFILFDAMFDYLLEFYQKDKDGDYEKGLKKMVKIPVRLLPREDEPPPERRL